LGAATLVALLGLVAYFPALRAGFIWDDDLYVSANQTLRSLDGLRRIWFDPGASPQYYPLTFTSFWIEFQLWGPNPVAYHATNVLLHGLDAVLLWLVLRRLQVAAAAAVAAIFLLHPMQVESVAWITERKNVLSALFAFSAVLVYLQRVEPDDPARSDSVPWAWYLATCALFLGALLSKSVTCTLPAVLLLLTWWRRGTIDRRTVSLVTPMFLLGLAMASITIWLEQRYVTAEGGDWSLSLVERALVAGRIFWFYPWKLLWPHPLIFIYPRWMVDAHMWWQYLFPAAAAGVIALLYTMRAGWGRGPLVATLFYAGTLAPTSGFLNVYAMRYSFVADHFAYLPMIGLVALVTAAASEVVKWLGRGARLGWGIAASCLLALAVLTTVQCETYRDLRTLWVNTLAHDPDCWMARNNLAAFLLSEGVSEAIANGGLGAASRPLEEAVAHLSQVAQMKPEYPEPHYNLGLAHAKAGKFEEAVGHYEQAIRLRPEYLDARIGLADALRQTGRTEESIQHYEKALQQKADNRAFGSTPDFAEAHLNLGLALIEAHHPQKAIEHFREALRLRPNYAEAHNNLGGVLSEGGHTREAIAEYEQALRLKPDFEGAHLNLGRAFIHSGRYQDAIVHFRQALRMNPDAADIHNDLGAALTRNGQVEEAIEQFEEALRLRPDDQHARGNLDEVLEIKRKSEEVSPR